MASLSEILSDVQGLRNDAATEIVDRYDSVEALADAKIADLVEIKGVGEVMAKRIVDQARTAGVTDTAKKANRKADDAATTASAKVSETATKAKAETKKAGTAAKQRAASRTKDVDAAVTETSSAIDEAAAAAQDGIGLARRTAAHVVSTAERIVSTAVAAAGREAGDGVEWTGDDAATPVDRVAAFAGGLVGKGLHTFRSVTTTTLKLVGGVSAKVTNRG